MHIKIQTSEKSSGNSGSSAALMNYLEKYDLEEENKAFENGELPEPRKGFFTHNEDRLMKSEIIEKIDTNKKGLGRNDSKFYSIVISPSLKEQQHILKNITNKNINSIDDLSKNEIKKYDEALKDYSRKCMNEYASHFKREKLISGNQILYAGKVEHYREYKGDSKEVKIGLAKSGERKNGLQSHIHVIVARKDIDMKLKLSPLANGRNKKNKETEHKRGGFDRNLFNIKTELLFEKQFQYKRELKEKTEYRIEASKNRAKEIKIELTKDLKKRKELERELINKYDRRNEYTLEDKELSIENIKILEKENQKNKELEI